LTEDYAKRVADDDDSLRYLLRTARAWAVSPTVFLGRAPAVVHTYDHSTGRLVRSETSGWSQIDRDMATALQDYEARLCSGCGGDRAETMNPENQFRYKGRQAGICHRCVALAVASQDIKHPHPEALTFTVDLIEPEQDS
jgi:hypothetical protein